MPSPQFLEQHTSVLFYRSWMTLVSFRKVRGLMVFLPFLKLMIAHLATPDWRERRLGRSRNHGLVNRRFGSHVAEGGIDFLTDVGERRTRAGVRSRHAAVADGGNNIATMAIRIVVTTWPRPRSLKTPNTDIGATG